MIVVTYVFEEAHPVSPAMKASHLLLDSRTTGDTVFQRV
jgi:hypothetical protein